MLQIILMQLWRSHTIYSKQLKKSRLDLVDLQQDMIWSYSSIYMARSFYIIGGGTVKKRQTTHGESNIARYDTTTLTWSLAGKLNTGRSGHGVIQQGLKFSVVGGQLPQFSYSFFNFLATPLQVVVTLGVTL